MMEATAKFIPCENRKVWVRRWLELSQAQQVLVFRLVARHRDGLRAYELNREMDWDKITHEAIETVLRGDAEALLCGEIDRTPPVQRLDQYVSPTESLRGTNPAAAAKSLFNKRKRQAKKLATQVAS